MGLVFQMTNELILNLKNEQHTEKLGQILSRLLTQGLVIGLQGEIGMGKTALVRACLQALGVKTAIKSPTFTLIESYSLPRFQIHHFDLYRLASAYELEDLGFRDYLNAQTICLIEWPEKAPFIIPFIDFMIEFKFNAPGRTLLMHHQSEKGHGFLKLLQRELCKDGLS